jgi:hypothetical protein
MGMRRTAGQSERGQSEPGSRSALPMAKRTERETGRRLTVVESPAPAPAPAGG